MNSLRDTTTFDVEALTKFFDPRVQDGGGAEYQPTYRRQRGHGWGAIFKTVGRFLIPFAKKFLFPSAVKLAKGVGADFVANPSLQTVKESLRDRGIEALKETASNIVGQSGSGCRKRRKSRSKSRVQSGSGKRKKPIKSAKYKIINRKTCYD